MSAPVTEAHIAKARASGYTTDKGVQMAAQFIANNEAAKAERDQLRAEVERLKPYVSKAVLTHEGTMLCSPLVAVKFNELKARAERAEAQLHALRLICGTTDADKFSTWVDRANARAERAEADADSTRERALTLANSLDEAQAELATERARLDWLEFRGPWEAWSEPCGEAEITLRGPIRAAIDAAMKEDGK